MKTAQLSVEVPPVSAGQVFKAIAKSVRPYWQRTLVAIVLLILAKLATVSVPMVLKSIIDNLSRPENVLVLPAFLLLAYAVLRFAGTLFGELRDLVFARVAQNTVADFASTAFAHLLELSPRFHVLRQTGRLTREVERGTAGIGFLLGIGLFTIVPTLVEIAAVLGIMTYTYSDWFSVIIVATFLVYTSFTIVFTQRREVYQRAVNEIDSAANNRLIDGLLNYETVKASVAESFEANRFRSLMRDSIDLGVRNQKALFTLHVGQSGVIALGVSSVMLLAGQGVVAGTMSVGDLVLINAYVIQICLPLNALGFVFRQANDALVNTERLFALLEQRPEIRDDPAVPPLQIKSAEVHFEGVDFGYDVRRRVLRDINFFIPAGGKLAVVGGSGSGKSTLARLLMRFYDVNAGRIRIDGQDIRQVTQRSLRAAIGIVPQDTLLFNQSIAYNIGYGAPAAGIADIIEAAKAAQLHTFISSLPQQYDTVVGERGLMLSGGEKQRLAIARVVLRNPKILIFDEATSALDARAERAIQAELDRLAVHRTTLVIAHRMSTIINADEIIVLEHGRIVERGTHQALLSAAGLYAQMWSLQQQERELERRESRLALQPVNLAAMAAFLVDALKPVIDERNIRLYTLIAVPDARVTGDPGRLQEIFWDLCMNAVQVTPPGGRVEILLERKGPNVLLKVTDTGGAKSGQPMTLDVARAELLLEQLEGSFTVERLPDGAGTSYSIGLPLRAVSGHPHKSDAGNR